MEVMVNGEKKELSKNQKKLKQEAPSFRVEFCDGSSGVIGMMATKVQVFITLPYENSLDSKLLKLIDDYQEKALFYIVSPTKQLLSTDESICITKDFASVSQKLGVYVADSNICAKGVFVINKDGEFEYIDILADVMDSFDLEAFETKLTDIINYKKKGHAHEDWMRY
jgi:thiol peroxidase